MGVTSNVAAAYVTRSSTRPSGDLLVLAADALCEHPPAPRTLGWVTPSDVLDAKGPLRAVLVSQLDSSGVAELANADDALAEIVAQCWPNAASTPTTTPVDVTDAGTAAAVKLAASHLVELVGADTAQVIGTIRSQVAQDRVTEVSLMSFSENWELIDMSSAKLTTSAVASAWELLTDPALCAGAAVLLASLLADRHMSTRTTPPDPEAAVRSLSRVLTDFDDVVLCDTYGPFNSDQTRSDVANMAAEIAALCDELPTGDMSALIELCSVTPCANLSLLLAASTVPPGLAAQALLSAESGFRRYGSGGVLSTWLKGGYATPVTHESLLGVLGSTRHIHLDTTADELVDAHLELGGSLRDRSARARSLFKLFESYPRPGALRTLLVHHGAQGVSIERVADAVAFAGGAGSQTEYTENLDALYTTVGAGEGAFCPSVSQLCRIISRLRWSAGRNGPARLYLSALTAHSGADRDMIAAQVVKVCFADTLAIARTFSSGCGADLVRVLADCVPCDVFAASSYTNTADSSFAADVFAHMFELNPPQVTTVRSCAQITAALEAGVTPPDPDEWARTVSNSQLTSPDQSLAAAGLLDGFALTDPLELLVSFDTSRGFATSDTTGVELAGSWLRGCFAANQPTLIHLAALVGPSANLAGWVCDTFTSGVCSSDARTMLGKLEGLPAAVVARPHVPAVELFIANFAPSDVLLASTLADGYPGSFADLVNVVEAAR